MNLAINGGKPVQKEYSSGNNYNRDLVRSLDNEDFQVLSGYRGNFSEAFWGGKYVQEAERKFAEIHNVKYALAVNSCTSALQISCKALGIEKGDEIIVTPWSMSCSATAPLLYGGVPVFADISKTNFSIDPEKLESRITEKTKGIIMVDLFGFIPDYDAIKAIAKKHNLWIVEDAAQAIGSQKDGKFAGTFGDVGCFSFTEGKNVSIGEGGMMVTNDKKLYMKLALLRNHSEAVMNEIPDGDLKKECISYPGYNMRMTEIQGALLKEALLIYYGRGGLISKVEKATNIYEQLEEVKCLVKPVFFHGNAFYVQTFYWDKEEAKGVSREKFVTAVKAELKPQQTRIDRGVPINAGYIKPLYKFPIFESHQHKSTSLEYDKKYVDCPNCEYLQSEGLVISLMHSLEPDAVEYFVKAVKKVWNNLEELL